MKRKMFRALMRMGVIILSLVVVITAMAFTVGNVDGIWGTADTNGAQCDGWASGAGDTPTYPSGSAKRAYWNQTTGYTNTDENQIRYGRDAYYYSGRWYGRTCANTTFAEQSGFGFDGNNGPVTPAANTPFYLGKFTHYNNPVYSTDDDGDNPNPLDYVDLTTTVPVTCNDGTTTTSFSFVTRFTLDETSNTAGTCVYPGTSICPDKVTITQPSTATFTCPGDGTYTVNILGFTKTGLGGGACDQSYNSASVGTEFITEEETDNSACLWAEISAPTADIYPAKTCVGFDTRTPYYEIVTKSAGPGSGVQVQIVDTLPDGVVFSSYTSQLTTTSGGTVNQGSCSVSGQTVTCQLLTSLPPTTADANAKWTVRIYVLGGSGTNWNNSVTASMASRVDPVPGNNTATATCEPTAVDLLSFTASAKGKSVVLSWETASETDNLGFNLYRAMAVDGERTQINAELIPASRPGSSSGAVYEYTDKDVIKGETYFYWLEDVDLSGATTLHGPVQANLTQGPRIELPKDTKSSAEGKVR